MKKYFPILLSKKGELVALQHLSQEVKGNISPIIQVLNESLVKRVKNRKTGEVETKYNEKFAQNLTTHWRFFDNQVILDFSLFENLTEYINLLNGVFSHLIDMGVNIVPSIQRNTPLSFKSCISDLIKEKNCPLCIRISNESGGFLDVNEQVTSMLESLKTTPKNTILVFDMGQLTHSNYNITASVAGYAMLQLNVPISDWKSVVVAFSSFPENLSEFDPSDDAQLLDRYEWKVWRSMNMVEKLKGIKYGDYGVRCANFDEVKFAGTVSLKYSTRDYFVVYRGQKTGLHPDGHGQYIKHAKNLVKSEYYPGKEYSWGDESFYELSHQDLTDPYKKTGNATNWVQFTQNHHMTVIQNSLE